MRKTVSKRTKLGILLSLAILLCGVAIGVIVPLVGSADVSEGVDEIRDFNYQIPTGADFTQDSTFDLRFVFTVGSLDYNSVGFVFSKTETSPTVGGDDCSTCVATKAYKSITADGETLTAPAGRWWIAVRLTGIPRADFDVGIHVRAYVTDGSGTRYSDAFTLSVCEANGHTHTVTSPVETVSATLQTEGYKTGYCSGCHLSGVTEYTGYANPTVYDAAHPGNHSMLLLSKTLTQVLNGEHFYPTAAHPDGLDLYFEVSILYNKTLKNYANDEFLFCLNYQGGAGDNLFYFTPKDNSSSWCKYAGGFDYGRGLSVLYGPPAGNGEPKENYPIIKDYGWHKIGVRVHQEAAIVNNAVQYSGRSYLYVDGVEKWEIELDMTTIKNHKNLLFTATISNGNLVYSDPDPKTRFQLRGENINNSASPMYFIYGDESWSAVDGSTFVPECTEYNPLYTGETLTYGGKDLAADYYYADAGHTHEFRPGRLTVPPTPATSGVFDNVVCVFCGAESNRRITYASYQDQISALQAEIASFSTSSFGTGSITTNLAAAANVSYEKPLTNPKVGQHPRVLFNESDIAGIKRAITNGDNKVAAARFISEAMYPTDGVLPAVSSGEHNYDGKMLEEIMSLALEYQLTGDEVSGYSAILAAKNYLTTMELDAVPGDSERTFGIVMYTMACVYDWCHDLLTATDKQQIVLAVQKKCCEPRVSNPGNDDGDYRMEIGFPPTRQSAVMDHGSEYQLLRDYLSFAIAIYDEYPGWWEFIGGRFYEKYVPVRNEFYKAGMVPQGISEYVRIRFAADLYSALLVEAMSGTFPYESAENMKQVMRTVYSYEVSKSSGKQVFASGDRSNENKSFKDYGMCSLLASYLFEDQVARSYLEHNAFFGNGSYKEFAVGDFQCFVGEELICSSNEVAALSDRHSQMNRIQYNGGWLGQIIARNNWRSADQAVVLMKIGTRTAGGHEHQDSGQFQIWYKGMLAGDTGVYDSFRHDHHAYYHQATIAHNSILVYDPLKAGGFYTGGQRNLRDSGPVDLDNWLKPTYKTAEVTGVQYSSSDNPQYAYIAGDLTPAYDSDSVAGVERRMLTVFDQTSNAAVPMYFFVYDDITAKSTNCTKTFLLHTVKEPSISGQTVTVINGDGKLVLQNMTSDGITKVGGTNENYSVNGAQLVPSNGKDDGYWGRVEITPSGDHENDRLLNVMYVCDKNADPGYTAHNITSNLVEGAWIHDVAAIFVIGTERRETAFSFDSTGNVSDCPATLKYYVSGVHAGQWKVKVDGQVITTVTATEEGGMLVFTAPSGMVELVPNTALDLYGSLGNNGGDSYGYNQIQ